MAAVTDSSQDIPVEELDRAYATIMASIVEHADAPHYAELAPMLGVEVERARRIMHELCAVTPGWMHPGTDWLGSFPPFNVQPTQYRIQIGERHGWFGQ